MSSRTPWTDEELRLLTELASRKVSINVISLKLGRSVAAVESKAAQQGIALKRVKRAYHRNADAVQPEFLQETTAKRQRFGDSGRS